MFRSVVKSAAPTIEVASQQVRTMATEKQIQMRIVSTGNIAKITKSMKMVSAAKMKGAQRRLDAGRPFASWLSNSGSRLVDVEKDGFLADEEIGKNNLFVVLSSDRGLCGGCNSFSTKAFKNQVAKLGEDQKASVFIIGDKGQGQLRRTSADMFEGHVTECWATAPSFAQASAIVESMFAKNQDFDKQFIIFNQFKSAISYITSIRTMGLSNPAENKKSLDEYEMEPDNKEEMLMDLREFEMTTAVFHGMIENAASEESSRMAAMENATKNAEEMVSDLQLIYNKARQSRITTELIEIISGASSLDDSN